MFSKSVKIIFTIALVATALTPALACNAYGNSMQGRIELVQTGSVYQGHVVFRFEPGTAGQSNSNTEFDYRFDASTNAGKITYAALLAAYSTGRDVLAIGCTNLIKNTEELRWLRLQ